MFGVVGTNDLIYGVPVVSRSFSRANTTRVLAIMEPIGKADTRNARRAIRDFFCNRRSPALPSTLCKLLLRSTKQHRNSNHVGRPQ